MNFRMIQAVIKCYERLTVKRFEEHLNNAPAVYLGDNVNKYT